MLSIILASGPLARLDTRFLPLVYNRRHFGVLTLFVAITHAGYIVDWYFAFSQSSKYEALLFSNTSYGQIAGFPFEAFGIFAILCLMILATTSHDFWLKFLTPPIWKRLHYLIYAAYASVVAHVAWGILQDQRNHTVTVIVLGLAALVAGLHIAAALKERRDGDPKAAAAREGWVSVCQASEIEEGRAKIAQLPNGDRVAVFRQDGLLSAISNACAHQNGPPGRGPRRGLFRDLPLARVPIRCAQWSITRALHREDPDLQDRGRERGGSGRSRGQPARNAGGTGSRGGGVDV